MAASDCHVLNDSETAQRNGAEESYSQAWAVTIARTDNLAVALEAPDLPKLGSSYGRAFFESANVRRVTATAGGSTKIVEVECRFSTAATKDGKPASGKGGPNDNSTISEPLKRPAVYRLRSATTSLVSDVDAEGEPFANILHEKFASVPERLKTYVAISVIRNEPAYPRKIWDFVNTVNKNVFWGGNPGTMKFASASADERFDGAERYWEVGYELHFANDGWKIKLLNDGTFWMERTAQYQTVYNPGAPQQKVMRYITSEKKFPVDANGVRTGGRVLLTIHGQNCEDENAQPTYLEFSLHAQAAWPPEMTDIPPPWK